MPFGNQIIPILGRILLTTLISYLVMENLKLAIGYNNRICDMKFNKKVSNITSEKDLILIGVMTTQEYLNTRAKAVFDTWGKDIPGKVIFFTSENTTEIEGLPIVRLKGIDDAYPPQRKSLMMLKYMNDHYLDNYHYFFRVDDDLHIRTDKLHLFLNSVSHFSKPLLIGQPGAGTKEESGKLGLEENEIFCMGGPGIILNRWALSVVANNIDYCLSNLVTYHEDVELWRCINHYARISCTRGYEVDR